MSVRAPASIHVTIDQIVLRSFPAREHAAIVARLRAELARLLAHPDAHTALLRGRTVGKLRSPAPPRGGAADPGARAAAAIVAGLRA
jgi:hypothetical protein